MTCRLFCRGIEAAWAGGLHGREVMDRLLPKLKTLLSPRGVFYMVVVVENRPNEIAALLLKDGFEMTVRCVALTRVTIHWLCAMSTFILMHVDLYVFQDCSVN